MQEPEIYCPKCKWRPRAEDRWGRVPSCGTEWNTFWTGGVCPGCKHRWEKTQCLACGEISLHKDWYHYPDGREPEVWQAFVAGGESDISARHQQLVLKKKCPGIEMIVQYKPGAGGALMWAQMNNLPADGRLQAPARIRPITPRTRN